MKIGLYPGSFDPITNGHLGVITKGAKLFDKLYVCILKNAVKNSEFTDEDKINMAKLSVAHLKNVIVVQEDGLTIDACKKYGANFILRGLRSSADFEFEFELNNVNKTLDDDIETILVMTNINESHISSSIVRELMHYNSKDYSKLVPKPVFDYIENIKKGKK